MKHKRFDYRQWHRVMPGTGRQTGREWGRGWVSDFYAGEVIKPLVVSVCGESRTILQGGFRWVQYAEPGQRHALTVHLDREGVPQQLYVDIGQTVGRDPDGFSYIDDLFLDVTALCQVQPDKRWQVTATEIIDVDEVEEALAAGLITQAQYDLAWAEARRAEGELRRGEFADLEVLRAYLATQRH